MTGDVEAMDPMANAPFRRLTTQRRPIRSVALAGLGLLIVSGSVTSAASNEPGSPSREPPALPVSRLVGATVEDSEGHVVGAIDDLVINRDGRPRMLIIGLAGALGLGEKDVAVPFSAVTRASAAPDAPGRQAFSGTGLYAGSSGFVVVIQPDLAALRAAPAFVSTGGQDAVGQPSAASGVPESVDKEPKSSTESGGPG